jgi:hypothetical protein
VADTKATIRYEDAAELRTNLSGWCCKACGRYWGGDENAARYCCGHKDMPCKGDGCTNRAEPHRTHCKTCCEAIETERWNKLPRVEWDGETPVVEWRNDKFFFGADELRDYLDEREGDDLDEPIAINAATIDALRLVVCEERSPRDFDMNDFLSDDIPEDFEIDAAKIDEVVNGWIEANVSVLWEPTNQAVTTESVLRHLGITATGAEATR